MGVMGPVQELPVFEARVQVDPKIKDYWGIPVARLSGYRHPNDIVVAKFLSSKAEAWLKEAGATTTWTFLPWKGLSGGQHQAGTCRMGDDPKTSVVDKFCRVHDLENVYVIDGSVHVMRKGRMTVCPGDVTFTVHAPIETKSVARHAVRDLSDRVRAIVTTGARTSVAADTSSLPRR